MTVSPQWLTIYQACGDPPASHQAGGLLKEILPLTCLPIEIRLRYLPMVQQMVPPLHVVNDVLGNVWSIFLDTTVLPPDFNLGYG